MGNIKDDWMAFKQKGNDHFKHNEMKEAVESYSKGISVCETEDEKVILYKNRSACYLKLGQYKEAIDDADAVLLVQKHDVKALFRRCQAYEALGNIESAYKDIKVLIQTEPKNGAIQEMHRTLNIAVQEKLNKRSSTDAMVNEMVETIANGKDGEERTKQALSNLVIYSHQSGGRDVLLKGGYFQKLIPILSVSADKCSYLMKICHGFSENNYTRALSVLSTLREEKLKEITLRYRDNTELMKCALSFIVVCITAMADHFKEFYKLAPEHLQNNFYIRESLQNVKEGLEKIPQYKYLLQLLVTLLAEKSVMADTRDAVIDAYIRAIMCHKAICDFIITNRGITKMLELASMSVYAMLKTESPLPVNVDTYFHVSVALSTIYDSLNYDEKGRKKFEDQSEGIIKILLESLDHNVNLQGLIALSTILMANREFGNMLTNKNDTITKVLNLIDPDEEISQLLGGEVLALAATDKEICNALAARGLPIMRNLYHSKNNEIRVRGLVSLCKVCMKGSGSVKDQILSEDGSNKLYKSCRKFLLSDKKLGLKKWAAEGLAYLTLDADVKELLVNDSEGLNGLLELAKSGDATVTYSVCNAFVNMTNSYDLPEKNPELEEIAKFAKQPLPEPHEKDGEECVKKRIQILIDNGLITALVNFGDVKSSFSKEMIARVFGAIIDEVSYRGKVVAQGGVKTLLPLALTGTEKGIDLASQSLAKIGITNDPHLAFSGQRCMEVIRPLVKLLHFKKEPLHRFEALMALTNMASMNDEVRRRIMKENGFLEVESLMFEEDDDYRRAATECMCNLVNNEEAFNKYKDNSECERLKLVTIYCGEDPMELSRAASGTLAILTTDVEICRMVIEFKSTLEIFKYLVSSENLELRYRGLYIVGNMIASEKSIAETIINDELFDVLVALKMSPAKNANTEKELNRCMSGAQKWELIKENPDS